MPRYGMFNENQGMIAKLDLDGWIRPEHWKGQEHHPEGWPHASVQSLIHLFTGKTPFSEDPDGIEIPNILGWHIAALIEDWGDHEPSVMEDPTERWFGDPMDRKIDLGIVMEIPSGDYREGGDEAFIERRIMKDSVERNRFIVEHTQRWYIAGIALYATIPPEERKKWNS